jgi:hypothetical protein
MLRGTRNKRQNALVFTCMNCYNVTKPDLNLHKMLPYFLFWFYPEKFRSGFVSEFSGKIYHGGIHELYIYHGFSKFQIQF